MSLKLFYVGIKGLIKQNEEVLLLKSQDQTGKKYWDIPGGRMNEGEEIQQTLERELKEELLTIQNIEVGSLIQAYKLPHNLHDGSGLMLLFFTVKADLPTIALSHEHSGYAWIGKDEVAQLGTQDNDYSLAPGYKTAIEAALGLHDNSLQANQYSLETNTNKPTTFQNS